MESDGSLAPRLLDKGAYWTRGGGGIIAQGLQDELGGGAQTQSVSQTGLNGHSVTVTYTTSKQVANLYL